MPKTKTQTAITEKQKQALINVYVNFQKERARILQEYDQNLQKIEKDFMQQAELLSQSAEDSQMKKIESNLSAE